MAALPARSNRRRRRAGTLATPINARTYRGTWLLVGLPLLVAAFSVRTAQPLTRPPLPPTFDASAALDQARELASLYPNRRPGSPGAARAASWVRGQLRTEGLQVTAQRFRADVGHSSAPLANLVAEVPGRTPDAIVVMAHRDDTGVSPGADDNASGTAVLLQLARLYAGPGECTPGQPATAACPAHRMLFVSTDGGAFGSLGADRFARTSPYRDHIAAVVDLDALARRSPAHLEFAGTTPHTASPTLVATAAERVLEQTGAEPSRPSAGVQLLALAFPFGAYAEAPLVTRGIAAVTLTTNGASHAAPADDSLPYLSARTLGQLGRASEQLVASLDQGLGVASRPSSAVYFGSRFLPGWSIELVLIACLLPFFAAVVDLFARCRRRRIALAPAWRSLRSRLALWLWIGAACGVVWLLGGWPTSSGIPPAVSARTAHDWPVTSLAAVAALSFAGWLVVRERLLPRRDPNPEALVAGHTVAMLALAVIALVVVSLNPFALVFLLPALHSWLWVAQLPQRALAARLAALAAGLLGPALLIGLLAGRYGLGLDAPWYLGLLVLVGYVPIPAVLLGLAWLAVGGQVAALAAGRYAPYPSRRERGPRGPIREAVRRTVLAARRRPRLHPVPAQERARGEL
jgi:hypothetical protein